jgi:hypothetical protein
MAFWKDREGKEVSFKEFIRRWKEGAMTLSPLQQAKTAMTGYYITLFGMIWGIYFSYIFEFWWLAVILIGNLIITGLAAYGNYVRLNIFKGLDKINNENLPPVQQGYIQ